ncbi:glycine-tRNA ligase [Perilla frutescens var. hirtella]|nr:glycine-tRNA ligase [Perilla frutescens var. hirtella]
MTRYLERWAWTNGYGGEPRSISDLETCIHMCEHAPPTWRPTMYRILQSIITRDPEMYAEIENLTEFSSALIARWASEYGHVYALAEQQADEQNSSLVVELELQRATFNSPPGFQAPRPHDEGTSGAGPSNVRIVNHTESLFSCTPQMNQWTPVSASQGLGQCMPHQYPKRSVRMRTFKFNVPETVDTLSKGILALCEFNQALLISSSLRCRPEDVKLRMKIRTNPTCLEEEKLSCALFMLTDDADYWWESKYIPDCYREAKEMEFWNLKQGNKTVSEYDREFNQLSRHAPHLVDTDGNKARKFKKGLSRESGVPHSQPGNTPNFRPCQRCERMHYGVCRANQTGCYNCGEEGHFKRECPKGNNRRSQTPQQPMYPQPLQQLPGNQPRLQQGGPQGQKPGMNPRPNQGRDQSMNTLLKMPVLALFDTGASHSFIAESVCKRLKIKPENAENALEISIPSGKRMMSRKVCSNLELNIEGENFKSNLYVIKIQDFDIILAMDWLASAYTSISCPEREVVFQPPGKPEVKIYGSRLETKIPTELGLILVQEDLRKEFERLRIEVLTPPETIQAQVATIVAQPDLRQRIIEAQRGDEFLEKKRLEARSDSSQDFAEAADNALLLKGRLRVPSKEELKEKIIKEEIVLNEDLVYEEQPQAIVDRKIQKLRNKEIDLVKVIWNHHGSEEATWELESELLKKYPDIVYHVTTLRVSFRENRLFGKYDLNSFMAIRGLIRKVLNQGVCQCFRILNLKSFEFPVMKNAFKRNFGLGVLRVLRVRRKNQQTRRTQLKIAQNWVKERERAYCPPPTRNRPTTANDDRKQPSPSIQPKNRVAAAPEPETRLSVTPRYLITLLSDYTENRCVHLEMVVIGHTNLVCILEERKKRHYLFFSQNLRDHVDNLSDKPMDNEVEIQGPPRWMAFDREGNPTKFVLGC